jgi:hypothetical protein
VNRISRRIRLAAAVVAVTAAGVWLSLATSQRRQNRRMIRDVLSESSTAMVRATCTTCHVFPPPDMLPRAYWLTAIRGMFQIAEQRNVGMPITQDHAIAWYVVQAPEELLPAEGRTDAGPGHVTWEREDWRPGTSNAGAAPRPAVTHVQMASLFGGGGLDVLVSDVATNAVYALRPYAPDRAPVLVGAAPEPGRIAVTDLDRDGRTDLLVAALGRLRPTNDPVGSVVWFRRTGPERFEPIVLADSLGRVADVQATDMNGDGRTDLLLAVFGWQENGSLMWLENAGGRATRPTFTPHGIDPRSGFSDVRAADLDRDGRLDVVALISQEFQQAMVYWGGDDGFTPDTVFRAPNPDWGFSGLEVADFTDDGLPDLIVTNGDNLDLLAPKPYHGVGLIENRGERRFLYRHLTAMYGAHRAVPVDLAGDGRLGLLVSAYLPPIVSERAPPPSEALIWLERVGPTRLVRRVLEPEGVDYMTMAAGDATGDGRPDLAVGSMDLGVVDPRQAHRGPPLTAWVTLWRNLSVNGARGAAPADTIDWRGGAGGR